MNQNKIADEYPEGSVSLATTAEPEPEPHICPICLESFDVIESKWGDRNIHYVETYCCKQYMHFKCLDHWVHGNGVSQGKHSCPLCRKAMDLGSSEYNDLHDENSPYFYHNPELYVWEHDFWYYRGPFVEFLTVIPFGDQPGVNVIPEEARNGQTDAEFIINWNRRGGQPNGDLRTWTMNPCQCSRRCYKGAYVLAEWPNGEFDPQCLLNECDFVLHEGKYVHKDCCERDKEHYQLAKTYTNNFQLNTCFIDEKICDETRLSDYLKYLFKQRPELQAFRRFKPYCYGCKRKHVLLYVETEVNSLEDEREKSMVLSENGWRAHKYFGSYLICKDCVKDNSKCESCGIYFPQESSFSSEYSHLCLCCGKETVLVKAFIESLGGFVDGGKIWVPQMRWDNNFVHTLNEFSKDWKFYDTCKEDIFVSCKTDNSKFIRAIVTLQRAYRKKKWAFVRKFSRNFTPGTYSAAMAEMAAESLQLWTPPGLHWRMLQCTMPECEGWTPGADDGFHSRTVMVLEEEGSVSEEETNKKHGWRYFRRGDEVCPCCYGKKRELARTFTKNFEEHYIDVDDLPLPLPEGLEWDELEAILNYEGMYLQNADCDDCRTTQYCVTEDDGQHFFLDNGWDSTSRGNRLCLLCPKCCENYYYCVQCDEFIHDDDVKYFKNKVLCEDCYEFICAVTIQRHVRGFLLRQKVLRKAAVTIQRICRGHIARKRMKKLKEAIEEYVRKESGGTMVLKQGMHELFYGRDLKVMEGILTFRMALGSLFQPYFSPETKCFGYLRCPICWKMELYTTDEVGYTGSQYGWEDIDFTFLGKRSVCPDCIKTRFTSCRGCSKSYYPQELKEGRCTLCLKEEAADASKRIQRAFRSYAKRKLYTAVRDAYEACCTFTDKFKPGLYRADDHCLSSFLKLMPSVEYLKKYDYVACECDDRGSLTDWVYIFDKTSPNYVPINRKGEWQCHKCLTRTGSKKRAATDQSEGQTSKRARSKREQVDKWIRGEGEDPRGEAPSMNHYYSFEKQAWVRR